MAVDFESEGSIGESVATKGTGRANPFVTLVLVLVGLGAMGYAYYVSYIKSAPKSAVQSDEEFNTARSAPNLSFDAPAPATENKQVFEPPPPAVTPPAVEAVVAPPAIQVPQAAAPPALDDEDERRRQEAERRRLEEEKKRLARLQSNMLVVDSANGSAGLGAGGGSAGSEGTSTASAEREEDPNRRFLNNMAGQEVQLVAATQNTRIDALIPQGTMIRGVLETAIQSDLPGMVRATISTDVYSFDGRRILLPKGTMITGEYRSGLSRGQTRVMIVWTRALRADGTSIALGSYGTDDLGRSGVTGDIDRHYLERFGSAAVLSLVGGVSSFIAGFDFKSGESSTSSSNSSNQNSQSAMSQAQTSISQTMSDMANQALKESINIPPTIHVDQGTQIIVFVRRDLDFSSLYPDPAKEALYELRHPKANAAKSKERSDVGRASYLPPSGGYAPQGMVTKP